uniref:Liver-expressed antimicrobial peptide 2 n=1 Tax=Amphilophus citrinellus TaxID=61819 RepID=A0A3Q0S3W3_AMPCI
MQSFINQKKAAALCIVLLMVAEQVCAGPLVLQAHSSSIQSVALRGSHAVHAPKRIARMTPLWRIMNSKPFGAYCQNNYECATGLCRAGHCSTINRSPSEPVNY